jgi:hypothetical protein
MIAEPECYEWAITHGRNAKRAHRFAYELENRLPHPNYCGDCATLERMTWRIPHLSDFPKNWETVPLDYHTFTIPKRSGGVRTISAPNEALKKVQQGLIPFIMAGNPIHPLAMGFMPGKSIVHHIKPHRTQAVLMRLDIHDFFGTVSAAMVSAALKESITTIFDVDNYEWRALAPRVSAWHPLLQAASNFDATHLRLRELVTSPAPGLGLPQGAPTSPILANACFLEVDKAMAHMATLHGARYTRYADDLLFSWETDSPNEMNHIMRSSGAILKRSGFSLNRTKTRVMWPAKKAIVCGVVIHPDGTLDVPSATKRTIRVLRHKVVVEGRVDLAEQLNGLRAFRSMVIAANDGFKPRKPNAESLAP